MPKAYTAMRDKFAAEGMSYDAAQSKAARIYNAKHKGNPVTAEYEAKHSGRKMQRRRQMMKRRGKSGS